MILPWLSLEPHVYFHVRPKMYYVIDVGSDGRCDALHLKDLQPNKAFESRSV